LSGRSDRKQKTPSTSIAPSIQTAKDAARKVAGLQQRGPSQKVSVEVTGAAGLPVSKPSRSPQNEAPDDIRTTYAKPPDRPVDVSEELIENRLELRSTQRFGEFKEKILGEFGGFKREIDEKVSGIKTRVYVEIGVAAAAMILSVILYHFSVIGDLRAKIQEVADRVNNLAAEFHTSKTNSKEKIHH
jgi:hypothetical protein